MIDNTTLGWFGVVTAVLFFGSYGVPIKLVKTGDGIFFQWVCASKTPPLRWKNLK
jgi:hypothetical protein